MKGMGTIKRVLPGKLKLDYRMPHFHMEAEMKTTQTTTTTTTKHGPDHDLTSPAHNDRFPGGTCYSTGSGNRRATAGEQSQSCFARYPAGVGQRCGADTTCPACVLMLTSCCGYVDSGSELASEVVREGKKNLASSEAVNNTSCMQIT